MVKIRFGIITVIALVMVLMAASFAAATQNMLSIESVKTYVNGQKDSGSVDVKPEDKVKFTIKVNNQYDNNVNDVTINNVKISIVIKDIDDGDNLDDESDEFDLDAGDSQSESIEFDIPLEVTDDSYDVTIEVEGTDDTNTTFKHTASDTLSLRVKKENHDVVLRRAELTSGTLKCSRVTSLDVNAVNMGTNEEHVTLKVVNNDLDLNKQVAFDLSDDPFDEESKYNTIFNINVDKDKEAGTYPINVRADYGSKYTEKVLDLIVEDCVKPAAPKAPADTKKEEVVVQVQPPVVTTQPTVITTPTTPPTTVAPVQTTEEKPSFLQGSGLIALIIGVDLVIIIIGAAIIIGIARKK